ncbi:MAG: hypothetical protein K0S06_891 [Microvirga sp.]|jgi:hypothetical protein|nr:hypothetical protein [Microvirga sp.]
MSATAQRPWPDFVRVFAVAGGAALIAGAVATIAVDPYWVFRHSPLWVAWTGGVNRLLDVDMRRAKPLQLFTRPAETVLVGSSTVYRGINPADLGGSGGYNFGVSSLMADELPAVAALLAARRVGRIAIGLDYFMFTSFPGPPRLEQGLEARAARLEAWAKAALSLRALAGIIPPVLASAYEPGAWRFDGHKATPDYAAAVTERIAREQMFGTMRYRPQTLAYLEAALKRLGGADVRLYLSPMSRPQRALASAAGRDREITQWRADVAAAAQRLGVPLRDLVDQHPFDDFDPARGSSRFWLDNSHFKPEVGRWIMNELGLPVKPM